MISAPELRSTTFGGVAAEPVGPWLGGKVGAGDMPGLRSMDAVALTDAAAAVGFFPFFVIDGRVLPRQVVEMFDRGEQPKIPILAGFNSGEIRSLRVLMPPAPADSAAYETQIRANYADLAEPFLKQYPAGDFAESMLATTRDALYGWTAERLVAKQTAASAVIPSTSITAIQPRRIESARIHAAEIPYLRHD
jgi:para-nitrobenzyl esterase